jgi:hypothetical protein
VLPPLLPTTLPRARLPHSTILMYTSQQHLYHPQLLCFSCKSIYLPYLVNGYIMCIVILNQKVCLYYAFEFNHIYVWPSMLSRCWVEELVEAILLKK